MTMMTCVGNSQVRPKLKRAEMTVTGTRAESLNGAPVTLLTVKGSRRLSRTKIETASVYHALIFHPDSRILSIGGGFLNEGPLATVTITWTIQKTPNDYKNTDKKELRIGNHAINKIVTLAGKSFSLSKGNLFIIKLNQDWVPESLQINEQLVQPVESKTVLDAFKSSSPGDEVIQRLELAQ
ncbi:MAG: hypothetical protein LC794_19430 [Acidobacteria bacterium]|nr:hypothetical protein [Acidobacteriota bacterium]